MKKYISEFIGTFALVFLGSGAYILAGNSIRQFGVALTFGLATVGIYYAIARISGGHINPAVTIGALMSNRIGAIEAVWYIVSQLLGALIGALGVYLMALGNLDYLLTYGLGQNGFGDLSLGAYSWYSAVIFELVGSFILTYVFLSSSSRIKDMKTTGIAYGLTVTAAYMMGMQIDGAGLNPARSFGPAVIAGLADKQAWTQLPLFLLVPVVGGLLAGLVYNAVQKNDPGTEFAENDQIEIIEE